MTQYIRTFDCNNCGWSDAWCVAVWIKTMQRPLRLVLGWVTIREDRALCPFIGVDLNLRPTVYMAVIVLTPGNVKWIKSNLAVGNCHRYWLLMLVEVKAWWRKRPRLSQLLVHDVIIIVIITTDNSSSCSCITMTAAWRLFLGALTAQRIKSRVYMDDAGGVSISWQRGCCCEVPADNVGSNLRIYRRCSRL